MILISLEAHKYWKNASVKCFSNSNFQWSNERSNECKIGLKQKHRNVAVMYTIEAVLKGKY